MVTSPHELVHAPALKAFALLCAGIAVTEYLPLPSETLFWIPLAAGFVSLGLILRYKTRRFTFLLTLSLAVGLIGLGAFLNRSTMERISGELLPYADTRDKATIVGIVDDHPETRTIGVSFVLEALRVELDSATARQGRVAVFYNLSSYTEGDRLLRVRKGDTIRITGNLRSPRPQTNPYGFDYREFLLRQGITTVLFANSGAAVEVLGTDSGFPFVDSVVDETRHSVREWIDAHYPSRTAPLIEGLILGDRGRIPFEVSEAFRDAGLLHILAVSGLHIGLLLAVLMALLGRLPYTIRVGIAVPLLFLYALMTGMAPPVMRAVLMASLYLFARCLQREPDVFNILGAAGVCILLVSPQDLFTAGFQLSFGAVFAIAWFYPRIMDYVRLRFPLIVEYAAPRHIVQLFIITVAAQIGTFPIAAIHFHQFSLSSFLSNLLVVPLSTAALTIFIPALLSSWLWHAPAEWWAALSSLLLGWCIDLSLWFSRLPYAFISMMQAPWWFWPLYAIAALYLFHRASRIAQKTAVVLLACCTIVLLFSMMGAGKRATPIIRIVFLDVGQGDAAVIHFGNDKAILIDTGPGGRLTDQGAQTIVPYLRASGVHRVEAMILSHADADHIGGAASILERIETGSVIVPPQWGRDALSQAIDSIAALNGVARRTLAQGDTLSFGGIKLYVLWPERNAPFIASDNASSIVLQLCYGSANVFFTGDADIEAEYNMRSRFGSFIASDILKAGHHGSGTATGSAFVEALAPRWTVISCGRLNRFRHPSPRVLQTLQKAGTIIFRTDLDGAVAFESDGRSIWPVDWRKE